MDKSQIARIVEFDLKVRGGWFPSRSSFAVHCGFSERTVARDIEYIRERLGAPLEFHKARMGHYYSKPWTPPSILMATYTAEEKEDYAVNYLMNMDEKTRELVVNTVIDLTKFDKPLCPTLNNEHKCPHFPDRQIPQGNGPMTNEGPAT